jgi:hypothetical protein
MRQGRNGTMQVAKITVCRAGKPAGLRPKRATRKACARELPNLQGRTLAHILEFRHWTMT